ncbi:L-dopachrome tautomerase-related protein [Vibrio hannami]|uniref:L-dopachrome tautomerase-related protein n=1 Tax=Vibrio hannami TaxID=2717094 RepID=UPI00240F7120|nr:L-dopachrome tautomerase-related protein [Vibrio hannami]MDG3088567.1 L-dopachrome tautomerase-related protein [Vibrio hannami]
MKPLKTLLALSTAMILNTATAATGNLEVVAKLDGTRPGNPTVTPEGRIILSMQPLDAPEFRVVELMANGDLKPFPTVDWADGPEKGKVGLASVIGVDTTADGVVYILDMGSQTTPAQIVAWDSVNNKLVKAIEIDKSVTVANSFLQDFALDTKRNMMYIADTTLGNLVGESKSAFVVVDLETGKARRVLESQAELMSPEHKVVINGSVMGTKRKDGSKEALYLGLNPITIDEQNEWVYFGTVNGDKVYRIPAAVLADEKASVKKQADSIEYFSNKKPSDGMMIGPKGNIYVGDLEKNAIAVSNQDGYRILAQDKKLLDWADGFSIDKKNGYLYMTQNQLHLHPALNEGEEGSSKPYHILRIKLSK